MNHNLQQVPATAGSNNAVAFAEYNSNEAYNLHVIRPKESLRLFVKLSANIKAAARKVLRLLVLSLEVFSRSNPY